MGDGGLDGILAWSWAGWALPGEGVSGDAFVVAATPTGALLAAIDGLGHGPEAAEVAARTTATLRAAPGLAPEEHFRRCHAALARTRGVVMSLAAIDAGAGVMRWGGVGNVDAWLVPADPRAPAAAIPLRGGILGALLPTVRIASAPLRTGDLVLFATDGIRSDFLAAVDRAAPPEAIAQAVLAGYGKATDDALVLVARYLGARPPGGAVAA